MRRAEAGARPEADDELLRRVATSLGRWASRWSYAQLLNDVSADDLVQVAWMGAWQAAQVYDPARGMSMKSWVTLKAKHALQHYVRDALTTARGVSRQKYERHDGRVDLNIPFSLDALPPDWDGEEQDALIDLLVGGKDHADQVTASVLVERLLKAMPAKCARMLWAYYGLRHRQSEIARDEGISQKHVSRQIQQGLWRARRVLGITAQELVA